MSTRSSISYLNKEKGVYESVYCHFDGYPSGVGAFLLKYWNDYSLVKELVDNGDMSSIGENISDCEFYRDRGDDWERIKPKAFTKIEDLAMYWDCTDYDYLFKDGKWFYRSGWGASIEQSPYNILTKSACDISDCETSENDSTTVNNSDMIFGKFKFRFVEEFDESNSLYELCFSPNESESGALYIYNSKNNSFTPLLKSSGSPYTMIEYTNE